MRSSLPDELLTTRLVAVMRGLETDRCIDVAGAIADVGISVLEVTMDSPNAASTIAALGAAGHVVGAGTVLSVNDAQEAVEAGSSFLVAPHTDPTVITWSTQNRIPVIPGAYTPSEVSRAWNLGASAVKLFPASIGGPSLVEAIVAPFAHIPLMVTGGINAENVGPYFDAGATFAGVGGWLVGSPDMATVRERAELIVRSGQSTNV
jgi:2-dehydro-3-deoxyphosphogluconate aldolase/(4S)-4-hydroxy-2-oxoglutarate aldolase